MSKITTFLTYNTQAEEAARLYVSLFPNSRIVEVNRYGEGGPMPAGTAMTVSFQLDGQDYVAMNGGPSFSFAEGFSLYVRCQTQAEVDELWDGLTAGGGEPGRCGWLRDRFGVSWQVIPEALPRLLTDPDPATAGSVLQAMLKMSKIDVAELERAARAAQAA
jgi:predicted 3-demethylubiquinone-9 3-methyltransferase (glyoxalase superfamily)